MRRIDELTQFKLRLSTLKRDLATRKYKLPVDDEIDLAFLLGQVEAELLDLDVIREWARNPMGYTGLPGSAIDLLSSAISRRRPNACERSSRVRRHCQPFLRPPGKTSKSPRVNSPIWRSAWRKGRSVFSRGPWWPGPTRRPATTKSCSWNFRNGTPRAIAAFRDFAAWLENDLKPRSTGRFAIGKLLFLAKLDAEEMIDVPLEQLLTRGEANLEKDYRSFVATAKTIDPNKSPAQVMKSLSDQHPTAEDLIPAVRRSVEAARKFLIDHGIVTVPSEVRPAIEETPPYARSGSFASMDTPGPYETRATQAFYYVTPVEKDWDATHVEEHLRLYNPPVVAMINVHEAYPGHYLQFLYAKRFPTKVRKLLYCGTNAEGWAHYCEQMMVDEGFGGGDPKIRLAQLQEALLRDCRYVVGIKLHTQGWTVEQGARLFVDKAFQEPANAYEEARRGAYNPTYLYYTFGKLEIQRLRDDFRARTGGTLRDFHDAFVAQGGLPLPLVRRILLENR